MTTSNNTNNRRGESNYGQKTDHKEGQIDRQLLVHFFDPEVSKSMHYTASTEDEAHDLITPAKDILKNLKKIGSSGKSILIKVLIGIDTKPIQTKKALDGLYNFLMTLNLKIDAVGKDKSVAKQFRYHSTDGTFYFKKIGQPAGSTKIKTLIVDDSSTMRTLLKNALNGVSEIIVVGEAEDGQQAYDFLQKNQVDVMTLDINMPVMNGVELIRKLGNKLIPTIMLTAISNADSGPVFDALELGAVDYLKKPELSELPALKISLIEKIKISYMAKFQNKPTLSVNKQTITLSQSALAQHLVVVGSSTGGTEALKHFLTGLPENIPPIVIVQHIPPVFSAAFANRMNELCKFTVKEAANQDEILPGHVYIAPGKTQIKLQQQGTKIVLTVNDDEPMNSFKPSVDYMFATAKSIKKNITALMFTGMGRDGAQEMKNLVDQGAYSIVQDEHSCVVFGMPKAAIDLGAAKEVVPLDKMAERLCTHLNKSR